MFDLRELYQEVIIDHNRNPRNFGELDSANLHAEGFNPLCGDKLNLYLKVNNNVIEEIRFNGEGCAISTATASLMTEHLIGKTVDEADKLFHAFHHLVTEDTQEDFNEVSLGKLTVLSGVKEFPSRVKCATLSWHTLQAALKGHTEYTETEE